MTAVATTVDAEYARQLTDRIKVAVEGTWLLVMESARIGAWELLGYGSWDEYVQREFGTANLRLPREDRQEVVSSLTDMGLSIRRIAELTGDSRETVRRSLAGDTNVSPDVEEPKTPTGIVDEETGEFTPDDLGDEGSQDVEDFPAPEAEPKKVTGKDGKRYASTKPSKAKARKPLTGDADKLAGDIRKVIERLERLVSDKRYAQYEEQVATILRGHLQYAADTVAAVLAQLP